MKEVVKVYATKSEDLLFEDFMRIEEMLANKDNSDIWIDKGVIPISTHSHGGGFLLGVDKNNADMIFHQFDGEITFVEKDIFSLLRGLVFCVEEPIDDKLLFKKWGEDFWRMKE